MRQEIVRFINLFDIKAGALRMSHFRDADATFATARGRAAATPSLNINRIYNIELLTVLALAGREINPASSFDLNA
ncbi:hypothetical protein [Methylocella silvestris]|uniref:hypothetical protein n=1 Tax=Methylocella silvestris TaxID=199596 RepID=UPI0011AEF529|nr:hypothetical protein [Methylocella silvestris]